MESYYEKPGDMLASKLLGMQNWKHVSITTINFKVSPSWSKISIITVLLHIDTREGA